MSKNLSKWSLPGNNIIKTSNSALQVTQNLETFRTYNTEFSNERKYFGSKAYSKAYNTESAGSFDSKNSVVSSTLSTIQGLNEVNRYVGTATDKIKNELYTNKDNKVYSYKLNQLIAVIKSSQNQMCKKVQAKNKNSTRIPYTIQNK